MPYSEEILRRATERLRRSAEEKQEEYEAHLDQAYARYPRLQEIDRRLRESVAEAVRISFSRGENPQKAIEALSEESQRLQDERQWILDAGGFDDDFLDDEPICRHCGGKGYIGSTMCECLRELCRQEQKKELKPLLQTGDGRFENFRLHYYSDQFDPQLGASPRQIMQSVLATCKRYAQTFRPDSGNLLFIGAPGLGKTFLSACIARQVVDGGASVVYTTAAKLISAFEAVKFGGADESVLRGFSDCDLLIIDDLGTEMRTQMALSALYTVINDRLMPPRATLISTNLRPEDLEDHYSPQIASRLLGCYQLLSFVGSDIRQMMR